MYVQARENPWENQTTNTKETETETEKWTECEPNYYTPGWKQVPLAVTRHATRRNKKSKMHEE